MSFISFVFYKSYLYFILYWLIDLMQSLENYIFEYNNNNEIKDLSHPNEFYFLSVIEWNISDLLAGFLVLYTYMRMKSLNKHQELLNKKIKKKKKILSQNTYELIYNDLSIKKNKYCLILLTASIDFISRVFIFFFILLNNDKIDMHYSDWLLTFDIFMRVFCSKYIIKMKFYKHHLLGLAINGICFSFLTVLNIYRINYQIKDQEKRKTVLIYLLFIFPRFIMFSLEDTINKILLMNDFILPHSLIFYRGVYEFFMNIILIFILIIFTDKIHFSFIKDIISNIHYFLLIIFSIFSQFIKNFIIMKVLYNFTVQHVSFLEIFYIIIDIVYNIFINEENYNLIITILVCLSAILIFFGSLIFNEIIIINVYGLDEGTREGLLMKEKKESNKYLKSINDSEIELDESNYINESHFTNEIDNNDSF